MKPLPPVHRDGLIMAKLCASPGLCLFCEEPVAVKRPRPELRITKRRKWTCGSRSCQQAYNAAWKRDWRTARDWELWRRRKAAA